MKLHHRHNRIKNGGASLKNWTSREYQHNYNAEGRYTPADVKRVQVGDIVTRQPKTFYGYDDQGKPDYQPKQGEVIWVHPQERFHVVQYSFPCLWGLRTIRECYAGVAFDRC